MSFIEFSEKELTGITIIDNQHKEMTVLVNKLYDILISGKSKIISKLMGQLLNGLKFHFETEENFMKSLRFPGYISHKLEHDRFYNQVLSFSGSSSKGKKSLTIENLESVRRWFFNHLEISDRKCCIFLSENGIK